MSRYKPKLRFSFKDIEFFFRFLLLRFSHLEIVVFVAARSDLVSILDKNPFPSKKIVFLREDNHSIRGNVFFIEAIRFLFRKIVPLLFFKVKNNLVEQLLSEGLNLEHFLPNVDIAIGDYYFNIFLRYFLKGKKIYFSNCVIPKIERCHRLHDSVEIQHGVIHSKHPDYANVPNEFFKTPLLCWGLFWKRKIEDSGFLSEIIVGSAPNYQNKYGEKIYDVGIFTTDNNYSISRIVDELIPKLSFVEACIQLHPRDHYIYNTYGIDIVKGKFPLICKIPIIFGASTLIHYCVQSKLKFICIPSFECNDSYLIDRLSSLYSAEYGLDYDIGRTVHDIVRKIDSWN